VSVLGVDKMKNLVKMFQVTEKIQKKMMILNMANPEYNELTKRTRILKPQEIVNMSLSTIVHVKRKELIKMFPETYFGIHDVTEEQRKTWNATQTFGDLVRSVLQKGQSISELLDFMIVPANDKEVKIVGCKYDEVFDVFLVKRVTALCDVYHFYASILQLPVQRLERISEASTT